MQKVLLPQLIHSLQQPLDALPHVIKTVVGGSRPTSFSLVASVSACVANARAMLKNAPIIMSMKQQPTQIQNQKQRLNLQLQSWWLVKRWCYQRTDLLLYKMPTKFGKLSCHDDPLKL